MILNRLLGILQRFQLRNFGHLPILVKVQGEFKRVLEVREGPESVVLIIEE